MTTTAWRVRGPAPAWCGEFQRRLRELKVDAVVSGNPGSAFDPRRYDVGRHARRLAEKKGAAETATPPWLAWTGLERVETVPAMAPGKSAFLVTGDPARNKELCLPGGGFATVRIRLQKAWDALMAERGYPPLETFFVR